MTVCVEVKVDKFLVLMDMISWAKVNCPSYVSSESAKALSGGRFHFFFRMSDDGEKFKEKYAKFLR